MAHKRKTIFITVCGGVAEVDLDTVPQDVDVEVIDMDELKADADALDRLPGAARAYAKRKGNL